MFVIAWLAGVLGMREKNSIYEQFITAEQEITITMK